MTTNRNTRIFGLDPRRVAAVARGQLIEFKRDFGSLFLSLLFPLFFVVVLVATNLNGGNFQMNVGLVNASQSEEARNFAAALASENISFKTLPREEALSQVHDGKLAAVIVFPDQSFDRGPGRIELVTERRFEGFARQVVEAARARMLLREGEAGNRFAFNVETFEQPTDAQFSFIYPGMLALALVQLGMFSTAMPLLRARERGTMRFLLLTPLTAAELVAGQVAFRMGVAACQIMLLLAAGSFVLDLDLGAWLAVFGVSLLGGFMLVSLGYALGGLPRSSDAGSALIMIVNFAMMFGGNIFWDPNGATVLKVVAFIMPASYLADLYRQIISGSEGLWPPAVGIAALIGWTIVSLLVAARTFQFDMDKEGKRTRRAAVATA